MYVVCSQDIYASEKTRTYKAVCMIIMNCNILDHIQNYIYTGYI